MKVRVVAVELVAKTLVRREHIRGLLCERHPRCCSRGRLNQPALLLPCFLVR